MASSTTAYYLLITLLLFLSPVHSQRKKEGCYQAAPITCDIPRANPLELGFSLQEVCHELLSEVFPDQEVAFDVALHEEYLDHADPKLVPQHLDGLKSDLQTLREWLA